MKTAPFVKRTMNLGNHFNAANRRHTAQRPVRNTSHTVSRDRRPVVAFRQRGWQAGTQFEDFNAPEAWHEPVKRSGVRYVVQPPGNGFRHAAGAEEIHERLAQLPGRFTRQLDVVQLSTMTRKRRLFPCYGMQWGSSVYLYPIEDSLIEIYHRPPTPQQRIEAGMFGGEWSFDGDVWKLTWTAETIRDFYLNNVLIHEVGHLNDARNTNSRDRERFANWFAIEYGYRATRR